MRIWLNESGSLRGLKRHFELQGDEIVKYDDAELVLNEPLTITPEMVGHQSSVGDPKYVVTRWFGKGQYLNQTFVGIPILGMMDHGLGADVPTGLAGRFVSPNAFDYLFSEPALVSFLKEFNHNGFITFTLSWDGVVGLQSGIPFWGLYAVLEGLRGKLSDWWRKPTRFYETWVGSLLVSKFPYPSLLSGESTSVGGISRELEEHIWMLGGREFKGVWTTDRTEVCVVSGADRERGGINDAARRILGVCRKIEFEGIQYRTDLVEVAKERWAELRERALV